MYAPVPVCKPDQQQPVAAPAPRQEMQFPVLGVVTAEQGQWQEQPHHETQPLVPWGANSMADFPTAMPPPPPHFRVRTDGSFYAKFEGRICNGLRFFEVELRNCHSTNCTFDNCRIIGGWIASSTLRDVKVYDAQLVISSTIADSRIERSALTNCQIDHVSIDDGCALDCQVKKAKIKRLRACRCRFLKSSLLAMPQQDQCTFEQCE